LRKAKARTRETLDTAVIEALATVTAADAHGWFAPAGDALQWRENRSKAKPISLVGVDHEQGVSTS
jgi:hypothetical protein